MLSFQSELFETCTNLYLAFLYVTREYERLRIVYVNMYDLLWFRFETLINTTAFISFDFVSFVVDELKKQTVHDGNIR